jgi:hypothetical protein
MTRRANHLEVSAQVSPLTARRTRPHGANPVIGVGNYFDFADNFRLEDGRHWSEIRQALQNAECAKELSGCVDYVLKNKNPILLSSFLENDGIEDARVVARKVDHWVVQPTLLVSVT